MKKYLQLTCTICKRDVDKLVNITHYSPDRCTITQGCEGRLQPIEYKSSAGIAVPPEVGVQDWKPRNSTTTVLVQDQALTFVNLSTGTLNQIVVASPLNQPTLGLNFAGKADTPKAYRSYIFRKEGAFSTISGVESGLDKKALRFTAYGDNPDLVEVYLNGVLQALYEDYYVADGTNLSIAPPNTIVFTKTIDVAGVTQIDVVVSKDEVATNYNLVFTRNISDESRAGTGAYENVDFVDNATSKLYLYTLDLNTINVPINTLLVPTQATSFMLAAQPYTQLDRYANIISTFAGVDNEIDYLKYFVENNVVVLKATTNSVVPIFPPLRMNKFLVEKPITVATAGVEEQLVIDGKLITGPDA